MKPRRQLNRYTQRELEVILSSLENTRNSFPALNPSIYQSAIIKSKMRLRREKERAK